MTRKDFELIANAIATVESDYKGLYQNLIGEIVSEIADRIEKDHPRFNRARFEMAAMPTKHAALRDAILAGLENRDDRFQSIPTGNPDSWSE